VTTNVQKTFDQIKQALIEKNFPLVGAVDYESIAPLYSLHGERYRHWIERSFHGDMAYLQRGLDRRMDPRLVFPELQSAIVVARPYRVQSVGSEKLRYARYLNGEDYHESMKDDLEAVFAQSGFRYKVCVDTSAVLERTWAALAGIGWIGKNTLLIHPQYGSYLFLGVVFTDQKFHQPLSPQKDYCGNCDRCMKACPTQAIVAPHDLDARKCISYLTLEKRGEWDQDYDTKGFLAGCDLCQEVCPYNTKPVKYNSETDVADYLELDEAKLQTETETEYRSRVKGTSLTRVKFADFKRNLRAALKKS
jgi:epoxyqueuosine reductase